MKTPENKIHIIALKWLLFICAVLLLLLIPHTSVAKKLKKKINTPYATKAEFIRKVQTPGTHYIIFAGDWCPHCKDLMHRLRKANLIDRVILLDTSKGFAFTMATSIEIPGIPSVVTAHTSIDRDTGALKVTLDKKWYFGVDDCMYFLMAALNTPKPEVKVRSLQELGL